MKKLAVKLFDFSKKYPAAFNIIGGAVCGVMLIGFVGTFEKVVTISTCSNIARDCEKLMQEEAAKKESEEQ